MGQLRSGILNLQKLCLNLEPDIQTLTDQQDEFHQRVFGAGKRIEEGLNLLVAYLIEKFKKDKTTFDAQANNTLQKLTDGKVATIVKGVGTAKADVKGVIAKLNAAQKTSANKLLAAITAATSEAGKLQGLADKKKAKLFKSAKYKAKITSYLAAPDAVEGILKRQSTDIKAIASIQQNDAWVERCYKLPTDMTRKQVRGLASTEFNDSYKKFDDSGAKVGGYARKFRDEYKAMGSQLATLKKWSDEADAMDVEADQASAPLLKRSGKV